MIVVLNRFFFLKVTEDDVDVFIDYDELFRIKDPKFIVGILEMTMKDLEEHLSGTVLKKAKRMLSQMLVDVEKLFSPQPH